MRITADRFRHTMGHLAGGVTVITVRDAAGTALGMTASAVTSLSLEPAMLLVCVDREAAIHDVITRSPLFGVNILASDQADVARRFADRARAAFEPGEAPEGPARLPLIAGAIAHLECRRGAVFDGGDHSIVTGVVEWTETSAGAPLLYFRSGYGSLAE
jgi:flavin reductase (DIM6/NTAB) family NADH-FMN oxidoreductase RutF